MTRGMLLFTILCVSTVAPAHSHPHVWVDARVEATVASGVVTGLEVEMTFDDIFSGMILQDAAPGAQTLSPRAIEAIRTSYFKDLEYFDYFIHLSQGKKTVPVPTPQRFTAVLKQEGQVQYRFFLPLAVPLTAGSTLSVGVYDETFYVDVQPALKNPVSLVVTGTGKATYEWAGTSESLQFRVAWKP